MKTYLVDFTQSEISFSVKLLNTTVTGTFESYFTRLQCRSLEALNDARIEVEIDSASICTNEPTRDQHLRSTDFFNTDLHPKIYFTKTNLIQHTNNYYLLHGILTVKNSAQNIVFEVHYNDQNHTFTCTSSVKRSDLNLMYNHLFEKINRLEDTVHIHVTFALITPD